MTNSPFEINVRKRAILSTFRSGRMEFANSNYTDQWVLQIVSDCNRLEDENSILLSIIADLEKRLNVAENR